MVYEAKGTQSRGACGKRAAKAGDPGSASHTTRALPGGASRSKPWLVIWADMLQI